MNSQSALRAEADSGDDSELSLSLFEKVQNEPVSFGLYEKCTSLTAPRTKETVWSEMSSLIEMKR